jgi:hypothetical protein
MKTIHLNVSGFLNAGRGIKTSVADAGGNASITIDDSNVIQSMTLRGQDTQYLAVGYGLQDDPEVDYLEVGNTLSRDCWLLY